MRDLAVLLFHLIATGAKLCRRGGARAIVAESLLLKHQLLILNRSRERAPNLRPGDRMIAGLCAGWLRPARLARAAIVLKPSTIKSFHRALVKQKYRWLFTPKRRGKPGPKGPSEEIIAAIVEMKRTNRSSAAGGSLNSCPLCFVSSSTRKSSAACWRNTIGLIPLHRAHLG